MNPKHEEMLTSTHQSLMAFYANSIVPRHTDDISKGTEKWIISDTEEIAFRVVLDVLIDCGAKSDSE